MYTVTVLLSKQCIRRNAFNPYLQYYINKYAVKALAKFSPKAVHCNHDCVSLLPVITVPRGNTENSFEHTHVSRNIQRDLYIRLY
jgi:hypothetical protein